jgi:hypothetical protein
VATAGTGELIWDKTDLLVRVGGRIYRGAVLHTAGRLRIRQAWHSAS